MKTHLKLMIPAVGVGLFVATTAALATDDGLAKAKGVVQAIQPAAPPQVSTNTKVVPEPKPVQKFTEPKAPPSPVDRNNPQHDPYVQAGFDKNQKEHADKVAAEKAAKGK